MGLGKEALEQEIVKCEAAIIGFEEGVELHKIMRNALIEELETKHTLPKDYYDMKERNKEKNKRFK